MNTQELFAAIEKGLNTGKLFAKGIDDYVSPGITNAQAALAELKQRVADLELSLDFFLVRAEVEFEKSHVIEYALRDGIAKAKMLLE